MQIVTYNSHIKTKISAFWGGGGSPFKYDIFLKIFFLIIQTAKIQHNLAKFIYLLFI